MAHEQDCKRLTSWTTRLKLTQIPTVLGVNFKIQWWFINPDTFVPGQFFRINEFSGLLKSPSVQKRKLVPALFVQISEISGLSEPGLTNHHCNSFFSKYPNGLQMIILTHSVWGQCYWWQSVWKSVYFSCRCWRPVTLASQKISLPKSAIFGIL